MAMVKMIYGDGDHHVMVMTSQVPNMEKRGWIVSPQTTETTETNQPEQEENGNI